MIDEDRAYRAAVGPYGLYDVVGAQQFILLVALGLRERHYLLDVGCGSLRAGRFFIPYLLPGHYYGIEPDNDLFQQGLRKELGRGIMGVKHPVISQSDDFMLTEFERSFHYVLAQSIYTHANWSQIERCTSEGGKVLEEGGVFAFTFKPGQKFVTKSPAQGWSKGVLSRSTDELAELAAVNGLDFRLLDWPHPNKLTWAVMTKGTVKVKDRKVFPPVVRQLLGVKE